MFRAFVSALFLIACSLTTDAQTAPADHSKNYPEPASGDYIAHNFTFKSGETLPEVRIHYYTLGTPRRDANGVVRNAVLILHGTGGSGTQFFGTAERSAMFAEQLFGPGQLLDVTKYFVVMPDNVGHGKSSKPSDGLRMRFPHYDYDDMVRLQHDMLTEGLHVNHLRLAMGTSMGCMHSWVWGETYPDFVDALMPLACLPVEIAGRNRMWRQSVIDAIHNDPKWNNGNYTEEPLEGLKAAEHLSILVGLAPLKAQKDAPTREAAEQYLTEHVAAGLKTVDANDMLYYMDASRNYNPEPNLEKIRVPVMAVNSADDFINPPELGIAERDIQRVRAGRFILIPISDQTRGHGTHTKASVWKQYMAQLLQESERAAETGTNSQSIRAGAASMCNLVVPELGPVYTPGPGITTARAVYTPDPDFPEDMRRARTQGSARVCIVVGPDGLVRAASVLAATEPSFGEKSVEKVQTWRFQPATREGQPVAMRLTVETTFNLR